MYQMQSWDAEKPCTCDLTKDVVDGIHKPGCPYPTAGYRWEAMEHGAAKATWKPRRTPQEAVYKCLTWTGLVGIPAMQVIDLETGDVIWRDSIHYPAAGAPIEPEWATKLRSQVKREQEKQAEAERELAEPKPRGGTKSNPQGALW